MQKILDFAKNFGKKLVFKKVGVLLASGLFLFISSVFAVAPRQFNIVNGFEGNGATGSINAILGSGNSGSCMYSGTISWNTFGGENVEVTVRDPQTGNETLFAAAKSGAETVSWFEPNQNYRFTVWQKIDGQREYFYGNENSLETWLVVPDLYCGGGTGEGGGTISFNLNSNKTEYCVTDTPTYSIYTNNSSYSGKKILWTSFKDGVNTSGTDMDYGFYLDANGNWSTEAQTWNSNHIGTWKKVANIDGVKKEITFPVEICGSTVPASGSISTTLGSRVPNQCMYNAAVSWTTHNANDVLVTVSDPELNSNNYWGNDTVFAMEENATKNVDWIEPQKGYRFTLWQINPASGGNNTTFKGGQTFNVKHLDESWLDGGSALSCGGTTPADFTLTSNKSEYCTGDTPLYSITSSPSMAGKKILWTSWKNNTLTSEIDADYGFYLNSSGSWSEYGSTWSNLNIGTWKKQANINGVKKDISFQVKDCSPVIEYTLITDKAKYCVGETPLYTIAGSAVTGNKKILWSSYLNNVPTGETDADYGFNTNANGDWQSYGGTWQQNHIGSWRKEANILNVRKSVSFVVESCSQPVLTCSIQNPNIKVGESSTFVAQNGGTQYSWFIDNLVAAVSGTNTYSRPFTTEGSFRIKVESNGKTADCGIVNVTRVIEPELVCQTLTPNVLTNQDATFSAVGGIGTYSWQASGGYPSTGSTSLFNTKYSTPGLKTVRVTSGARSVDCPVLNVTQPANPEITCEISSNSSTVDINENVSFRASGGNGTYAFNAPTGNPSSRNAGTNPNFTTKYSEAGSKFVTVISDSKSTTCPVVTVRQPIQTLTCTVSNPNVKTGETAYMSADGGIGSYSWIANGGSPQAGSNKYFNTSYAIVGNKSVSVSSGSQTVTCREIVVTGYAPVCQINTNGNLNHNGYVQTGSTYKTNISYSFSGNNPVRIVYQEQNSGAETTLVSNATNSGSRELSGIEPNRTYLVKMIDTSSCGGIIATLVIRQNVDNTCVSNSNYALNISTPVKNGNIYSVNLNWTSTGNHQIKIAMDSSANIITTGSNTGSFTVNNLAVGTSHIFYMIDATCNTILSINSVSVSAEQGGGNYNYCVNNSCNYSYNNNSSSSSYYSYYYYQQGGNNSNEYRQLSINKTVRLLNGSWQESVTSNNNDLVEFQIVVRNTGNQPINSVRVTDILPSGLSWVSGSFNNNSEVYVGTLYSNDSRTFSFQARVNSGSGVSIQNTARAFGDNVSQVQDDAWVYIQGSVSGGNVNLSYSKKAINDTKNAEASSVIASREDYITYTLTVTNNGNTPATNFSITDDLASVLQHSDMVDRGGGTLSGNTLTYPGLTVPSNGSVSKSFKVRVKYSLGTAQQYTMTNTYGNTITVRINQPQVLGAFVAPKTGADSIAFVFGGFSALGYGIFRNRKLLAKLAKVIFT